ncbi:ABC transporter permease [Erythrobacter sp. THAF29]|uniref:cell division protein FtsX n=1 Tax=Erythrobacter sp. THAF29 TaxID=2587851 RepID=UPI001268AAA5|nr:FtsX-like permease family protein [Erythrobacter sp. THAF29]QFT76730.1 cell division ABC transporter subunit FtsX [Erythrobacter sp. THAF29]
MNTPPLPEQSAKESTRMPETTEQPHMRGSMASRLLPQTRIGGPIPWVIAILIALVVIAAAGGLSLRNLAENARADLSGAVTVQIPEADAERRAELATRAARTIADQPLVTSVRIVPEEELEALLEPWLGAAATSEDVPIPALIDVELSRRASPQEVDALQAVLDQTVPGARVDAQSEWLKPVYDALSALQYLALALIALVGIATAAAVWLAARNAFANHRETVEVIHLLGGTDAQVANIFQRAVLRDAAFGAFIGLVLGIAAVWLLGRQFAALDSGMVAGGGLGWHDWVVIALIPVGGVLLALVTGRVTIRLALRSML